MKGGPYWHVIRFLDHPLLPANTTRDFPKIIKHGIDDDGPMHPQSPHVSAPDGAATLMYKMSKEDWLQRFLDVSGTYKFELVIRAEPWEDLYIKREGNHAEIGFLSNNQFSIPEPSPGVRYRIQSSGEWVPICTSDMGNIWGGTPVWVRAQGEAIAKAFWYHQRWSGGTVMSIDWTGISDVEKEDNRIWCENFKKEERDGDDPRDDDANSSDPEKRRKWWEKMLEEKRRTCRGGCGEGSCKLACSRCKEIFYCSVACQKEDWKYHKSVCAKSPY